MSTPNDQPDLFAPDQTDGGPAPDAAAGGDAPPELAQLRRERDDLLGQLQRSRAEFLNYQKRARTQADLDRQYATSGLATDLLGVLDNLERGIEAARAANQPTILEGLDLVYRQFLATLAKHGVEPIAALGMPFDPNYHEALLQQPDASQPEGTVVAELGRGYRHHDRVLRPARVAVSKQP
jgi:molecular chaperone GrpE